MLLNNGQWSSMIGSARHSYIRLLMEGKCQLLELCSTPLADIADVGMPMCALPFFDAHSLSRSGTTSNMKDDTQ